MKKVVIASKNPVKAQATQDGFKKMFPKQEFEFTEISVPSDVNDQPFSDDETLLGAKNRANNASKLLRDADFYVGIEGGIEAVKSEMQAFAWVVIKSTSRSGKDKKETFFLSKKVVELLKKGHELGNADYIVFQRKNKILML